MNEVTVFIRSMRFLGTQIVSYPMLWQIRQFWPECRLRVVAQDDVARHYLSLPWVDEFIQADSFVENYRALGGHADMMIGLHFASDKYGAVAMARLPRVRQRRLRHLAVESGLKRHSGSPASRSASGQSG